MAIGRKEVEHVASLARLALTEDEKKAYEEELRDVITFMDKLEELDTEGIEPTIHVLDMNNVFRKDEIQESLPIDDVLKNAPDSEEGCFVVPSIL
ncbi:asparaginyl/glutamyl-tRNA amidotransferase subunit C [endosymbiont 'TC1' of Trimyema compressum]|uniref:Asp-tRNA(Asn)/Glu-tRNA(Gln) amidotransferase subunit GatC n=1 Tax=endosymbiont 'TC1' of Trimyema compressum TaxID=243899 RepID=UPI0007F15F2E|nr:Asp-tRNA(Asn)/Glu-tRNA(Gln) amidotransferase subunit GatC [endosymbiont 'TC1' of Trimyema compressum]AMP21025.1 asparaginyl/glutamyl-tRNA amidotransferase subunit C [endosymbiont 'TC1' of Trimyema compressum]